jgi:hypothetical protein
LKLYLNKENINEFYWLTFLFCKSILAMQKEPSSIHSFCSTSKAQFFSLFVYLFVCQMQFILTWIISELKRNNSMVCRSLLIVTPFPFNFFSPSLTHSLYLISILLQLSVCKKYKFICLKSLSPSTIMSYCKSVSAITSCYFNAEHWAASSTIKLRLVTCDKNF